MMQTRTRYAGPIAPAGLLFGAHYAYTADHYFAADCDGDGDEDVVATSNPAAGDGLFSQIFWNTNGMFSSGGNEGTKRSASTFLRMLMY